MLERRSAPHPNLSYENRREISYFKDFDWIANGNRVEAVDFARCTGFKETGMSVNEVALLYDLLEQYKPKTCVELGRNYGCSTRLLIQHIIRNGGRLESWDLKHWDGFLEGMASAGYKFPTPHDGHCGPMEYQDKKYNIDLKVANTRYDLIGSPDSVDNRFIDFLLIDTEHGIEDALGEYMRFRHFLRGGAIVAFHDSTLPGVKRAIEIAIEVEDMTTDGGRLECEFVNEREDGYGVRILKWR